MFKLDFNYAYYIQLKINKESTIIGKFNNKIIYNPYYIAKITYMVLEFSWSLIL